MKTFSIRHLFFNHKQLNKMAKEKLDIAKIDSNEVIQKGTFSNADLLEAAENAGDELFKGVNGNYLKIEEGEVKTLILKGIVPFNGDNGETEAAEFEDKAGETSIHAGAMVVSQCKKIAEKSGIPCIVRLLHKGMKKQQVGKFSYAEIEVRYLKPLNNA